jgi:hypothetical protein
MKPSTCLLSVKIRVSSVANAIGCGRAALDSICGLLPAAGYFPTFGCAPVVSIRWQHA